MQNLLTKQGLQGVYNTDLHELQKNCHLNHIFQINTFYEISVYTKLNVCEDLEFIIQAFFPLGHKVFVCHFNSCVHLIQTNKMKAADFRFSSSCCNAIPWYHGYHRLLSPAEPLSFN